MDISDLKHAQRQRLLFLDKQFSWKGSAKRRDLIEAFGTSMPQAALDFKQYLALCDEDALRYDPSLKTYIIMPDFKPIAFEQTYGAWRSFVQNHQTDGHTDIPLLQRPVDPQLLALISRAITNGEKIAISYISMSSGDGTSQWIAPTHFASDGQRHHVRAYSFKHKAYRDYLPSRISLRRKIKKEVLNESLPIDTDWHNTALIWLTPKATLTEQQKQAVRHEYGFTDDLLLVSLRSALEFYADRRWGLDQQNARLERYKTEFINVDIEDYASSNSEN